MTTEFSPPDYTESHWCVFDASTGEIFSISAGAPSGKIPARRSTVGCESQLLADPTRRPGTFAPIASEIPSFT